MEPGTAYIGAPRGILASRLAQFLKLAAADIFEICAIRPRSRGFVEVDGDAESAPDFKAGLARQQDALLQLDPGNGHERDDVRSADAGIGALLTGEIDQLGGLPCPADGRFDHPGGLTCDG